MDVCTDTGCNFCGRVTEAPVGDWSVVTCTRPLIGHVIEITAVDYGIHWLTICEVYIYAAGLYILYPPCSTAY